MSKMNSQQYTKACTLIKNICANFDNPTGLCLPLDTKCPQMITSSLVCKYFRDVLLEDKEGQLLKAQIFQDDSVKKCEVCGRAFRALSNRCVSARTAFFRFVDSIVAAAAGSTVCSNLMYCTLSAPA